MAGHCSSIGWALQYIGCVAACENMISGEVGVAVFVSISGNVGVARCCGLHSNVCFASE